MKDILLSAVAVVGLCSLVGCGVQQAREAEAMARDQAIKQKNYDAIIKQLRERNKTLIVENAELRKQVEVMYGELHKFNIDFRIKNL